MENANKNALYISPQIQNEIIHLSGETIKDKIVKDVKDADAYSILADASADISGKEQLSVGVRFFYEKKKIIREEFLGLVEMKEMDAESIATAIDHFIDGCTLDPIKCVGQGYDGAKAMSGHIGGVQTILRRKYQNGLFFHCASHRLNLVVNDLNKVVEVRNTIGTIKTIINFFRESTLRRKLIPNIPTLCETRWSEKHKCIGIFKANFETIVIALDKLSIEGNADTRKLAFPLHAAATQTTFIICVCLIAKYSALLEPVVNILQSKSLDLFRCAEHIKNILSIMTEHRQNADHSTKSVLDDAQDIAGKLDIELSLPRIVGRQTYRSNPPFENFFDYWKKSIVIPYLDSMINSLQERFSDDNSPAFGLLSLHPYNMLKVSVDDFKTICSDISNHYNLKLDDEYELWYSLWKLKKFKDDELNSLDMIDVLKEADTFFPYVKKAIHISLAQPCSTTTIERSFSTMRRVKTWLRSTMRENRLSGNIFYRTN